MKDIEPSINNRSFLKWWVLANMLGFPIIWGPMELGTSILNFLGKLSNGVSLDFSKFIFPIIMLPLGGAVMSAWLGLVQWLVLRKKISSMNKWITASSIAGLIGAPLSWITFIIIANSQLAYRSNGYYLSDWYSFASFGGVLGFSLGISQWLVLRRLGSRTVLWVFTLPVCFIVGMAIVKSKFVTDMFVLQICQATQKLAQPFQTIITFNRVFSFFTLISIVTALISMSLITGVVLNWLLHSKEILLRIEESS